MLSMEASIREIQVVSSIHILMATEKQTLQDLNNIPPFEITHLCLVIIVIMAVSMLFVAVMEVVHMINSLNRKQKQIYG